MNPDHPILSLGTKLSRCVAFLVLCTASALAADPVPVRPLGADGKALNLDFETGTLQDWKAEGRAFEKQPVKGDAIAARRKDMKSQHQGDYWIGTFEALGDDATGTLTSAPFKVTHRWASFLVAGGSTEGNRVELARAAAKKVFFKVSGFNTENLAPVVVALEMEMGQ